MKRMIATFVASIALLALPSAALAQGNSTCQGYNPQACGVKSGSSTSGPSSPAPTAVSPTATTAKATSSTLPFTGLDVGLLAAGGAALLGAGLVVRRLSSSSN